jgi:hypothetical protein
MTIICGSLVKIMSVVYSMDANAFLCSSVFLSSELSVGCRSNSRPVQDLNIDWQEKQLELMLQAKITETILATDGNS